MSVILNEGQQRALDEINAARKVEKSHLLTGYAGSGKTVLMQHLAITLAKQGVDVVLTAPTHKAVSVLARKLSQSGVSIPCQTVHSLLSLRPKSDGERQVFERAKNPRPITAQVVVIDEASMLSEELVRHVRNYLGRAFVLFVGDPAQLPPVNEVASQAFGTRSRSHLDTIIRQAQDNPVLSAAHIIRRSQDTIRAGGAMDWSWVTPSRVNDMGVFSPGECVDAWMEHAFTSEGAAADPDRFRYLCWTNEQVRRVNKRVRRWIYGGDTPTPYMPGERIMMRSPAFAPSEDEKFDGDAMLMSTNEEATVLSITPSVFRYKSALLEGLSGIGDISAWTAEIPCWTLTLLKDDETKTVIDVVRDTRAHAAAVQRMKTEAEGNRQRWQDFYRMKGRLPDVQSPYALTVHNSQGSTFTNCFIDVANIRGRERDNPLEFSQLLYVAATRPTHALVLVGA